MKRYLFGVGAAALVAASAIIAAEVRSVNTVGFKKLTILSNHVEIVGIPFDAFDQTLMGVFGTNQLTPGKATSVNADKIWVWDASSSPQQFRIYGLRSPEMAYHDLSDWDGPATNPPLKAGNAVWVKLGPKSPDTTITLMGEVVDVTTQQVDIVGGANLVAYPFSTDIKLKDTHFAADGLTMGGAGSSAKADKLWVWNGSNAFNIFALKKTDTNWYNIADWEGSNANDTVLEMGKGFWLKRGTNVVLYWTETNTYLNNL